MNTERGGAQRGPRPNDRREHENGGVPGGITPADVEHRRTLVTWLSDAQWPADRDDLLAHADTRLAPGSLVSSLRDLPDGEFHDVGEVARALGLGKVRRR
ncbi:hypothetical protein GCM10017673_23390 [Streptosporangium violaceochromogenes]|nr:hypothetical protein GCM10017673_23390 [Streptosporangium violaceochromogenes]